jgi:hypothetical protein
VEEPGDESEDVSDDLEFMRMCRDESSKGVLMRILLSHPGQEELIRKRVNDLLAEDPPRPLREIEFIVREEFEPKKDEVVVGRQGLEAGVDRSSGVVEEAGKKKSPLGRLFAFVKTFGNG